MRFSRIVARSANTVQQDVFWLFDLADIFPGYKLLVNISLSIMSLLDDSQEHSVIAQRILTEAEMRVLLPLLDAPTCCQQEVLQASSVCAYEFLIRSLPLSDLDVNPRWSVLVQEQRERLLDASAKGTKRAEMRVIYNAVFGLRQKLEELGLTIRSRRDGYYLALLVEGENDL